MGNLPKFPKCPSVACFHLSLLLLLTVTVTVTAASPAADPTEILYNHHCAAVIPPTPETARLTTDPFHFLTLRNAQISGENDPDSKSGRVRPRFLHFYTESVRRTQNDDLFKLEGRVELLASYGTRNRVGLTRRGLRRVYYRPPKFPATMYPHAFQVIGFWNSISGKLCMIGSGLVQVALKLDYFNSSNLFDSLVNGSLQMFDVKNQSDYSKPLQILGFSLRNYRYSLVDDEVEKNRFSAYDRLVNGSLGLRSEDVCSIISNTVVELEYLRECDGVKCDLLGGISSNFTPRVMSFNEIECSKDGRARHVLFLSDQRRNAFQFDYKERAMLVAEGKWDEKKHRLDMVACRVLNGSSVSGSVGDCTVRLSVRLPSHWTLRERSVIVGNMWSTKSSNESGYFPNVVFRSTRNKHSRPEGVVYEYTEIEKARMSCANKMISKGREEQYPKARSSDMRFDTILKNKKGNEVWAYSSPLAIGENFFKIDDLHSGADESTAQGKGYQSRVVNVSFVLVTKTPDDFMLGGERPPTKSVEISAEGLYDSKTGHLCMVGCMHSVPKNGTLQKRSLDCEVLIDIQYPPLNSKAGTSVRGTIESLRMKYDPLYFEPLEILSNSLYHIQVQESIWRMDLEVTLALISNTLVCVFVGLQLLHVKKHPNLLPFISVIMMVLVTLAHMIPLLLNFEAVFLAKREKQNVYLGGEGWLEVNEVLVRVITMVAFLLEFRLLQLTWSSRAGDESQTSLWTADKKVLFLSTPLYIFGGLIACFVHLSRKPYQRRFVPLHPFHYNLKQQSLWGDLKSYGGLILDGFLLPQILFNLFYNTTEKALAPSFYLGGTLVRLLPHVYDLYRAHSSTWTFNYIYANPNLDYYSTSWDIIICCGGLLFAFLVFLQQRFGGRCFLPKKLRERTTYEKVPTASNLPDKPAGS